MIYCPNLEILYVAYVKEHVSKLKDTTNIPSKIHKIDCIGKDGFLFSLGCKFMSDKEHMGNILKMGENK